MCDRVKTARQIVADKSQAGRTLEDLFRLQRRPLLRFVTARVGNETEAEEIVQEAFIRFQSRYDPAAMVSPAALLARIAANLVIDRAREKNARAQREDAWGKAHTAGAGDGLAPFATLDPARELDAKQQVAAAMAVLDALPDKTRTIFLLHRFEGLSHAEVSERTGIPKSTIEKHMIRAIRALAHLRGTQ